MFGVLAGIGYARRMMKILGLLLLLIGGVIMLTGGGLAMLEFAGVYSHALSVDPLAAPEKSEQETSEAMVRWLVIGALGFPLLVAGSVMLKVGLIRMLYRKVKQRHVLPLDSM